jgi:uncharacterized damage-inducible protein DinB
MATPQDTRAPAWSIRLAFELSANDQSTQALVAGLSVEQLNWQPVPGSWSVGQCLEHLCITNESYVARLKRKRMTRWSRLLSGGSGAGLSAVLSSLRQTAGVFRRRLRSDPGQKSTSRLSVDFSPITNRAANSLFEPAVKT